MSDVPFPLTEQEVIDLLMEETRQHAAYWANLPDHPEGLDAPLTLQDRCEGVAFSILAMLDGCTAGFPGATLRIGAVREDGRTMPDMEITTMLHEHFYPKPQENTDV